MTLQDDKSTVNPCATQPKTYYSLTKALAESAVLKGSALADEEGFKAAALRPLYIFGPYDDNSTTAMFRLPATLGSGETIEGIFVENLAHAHIVAADALEKGLPNVSGRAFFIGEPERYSYKSIVDGICKARNALRPGTLQPSSSFAIPMFIARPLASFVGLLDWLTLRMVSGNLMRLNGNALEICAKYRISVDSSAFIQATGYQPLFTKAHEMYIRTVEHYLQLQNPTVSHPDL